MQFELIFFMTPAIMNGTHHAVNHVQADVEEFSWRFHRRFCDLFNRMLVTSVSYKPACRLQ